MAYLAHEWEQLDQGEAYCLRCGVESRWWDGAECEVNMDDKNDKNETKTLFGFPVVITDAVPKGEILIGRFPTWLEVQLYGSFEAALEAQKDQWAKIKGLDTE